MLVKDYMHRDLATVTPDDQIRVAYQRMRDHNMRHLPVVDDAQQLVGILTDRDIRTAGASDEPHLAEYDLTYLLDKMTVRDIMTQDVVTVHSDTPLAEAGQLLVDKKFGCLPVVRDGQTLEGILTVTDLLRAYVAK